MALIMHAQILFKDYIYYQASSAFSCVCISIMQKDIYYVKLFILLQPIAPRILN